FAVVWILFNILLFLLPRRPRSTLFPYTTLFRSRRQLPACVQNLRSQAIDPGGFYGAEGRFKKSLQSRFQLVKRGVSAAGLGLFGDRKSTRLNSSHVKISYAVFCLKKKTSEIGFI